MYNGVAGAVGILIDGVSENNTIDRNNINMTQGTAISVASGSSVAVIDKNILKGSKIGITDNGVGTVIGNNPL